MEFYEDKGLDVRFRSRLADFRDSGYDRGHMVTCHQAPHYAASVHCMIPSKVSCYMVTVTHSY